MRKYIVVALLLVAVGIGVSFFLLPSKGEVQIAQQRDQQTIDTGKVDVEAEYNAGRRSFPIVSALADKRIAEGNRPAAVTLWEEYTAANPNDAQGHKKLAEQYQLSGDQVKYNQQLEMIAQAEPTEANLRVLSDVYNADKNYPKQVEVLKQIVQVNKGEKPQDYVDLATIQVAVGAKDDALATLAELRTKHPEFKSYAVTRINVSILSEQGKTDDAFAIAKQWVDTAPIPTVGTAVPQAVTPDATVSAPPTQANQSAIELADLTNILNYSGHPDKAVELAEPHTDWIDTSSELAVAYVNAMINVGRTDEAYNLLASIEAKGQMVPELYVPYLQLAVKKNDMQAAENIANTLKPNDFNEEQALNIVEVARAGNAPTVLAILEQRFDQPEIIKDKPVLAAVLAILTKAKDQDQKIETALNIQLTSLQKLRLAESCARAEKKACFDAILAQYPSVDKQTTQQTAEYAQLYIIANRPKDVIDAVGLAAAKPDAHPDVVLAHVRLGAAAGRKDITVPWLEANANTTPMAKLQDLFFLANDRHHSDVSMDIAERLYARDPSPMNRDILVAAYVGNNQHEKALPFVRQQMQQQPNADDSMYIATLSKVGRKDASARKELTDYAEAKLKAGAGDDKAQLNYAYVLLNNGKRAEAMPYIQANAKAKGGEWKKMYAQLTAKGGKGVPAKKLTREERVAMASNPKISEANKREIAFSLLNDGFKADATKIFGELAANKGPDSQEVKDLLYMWGGKLNADQLAWVQQRAANSNPYDKEKWAELINTYGDDYSVMQYVSATPDALYNKPLRKKYFRVLAQTGNKQYFDGAMRNWVAQTTDVPALLDYSNTAQAFGYRDAAYNGYKRVEVLDPNNTKALDALASLDFGKGSYKQADQYLNRAIVAESTAPAEDVDPAQARFLKAEMLKRQGNMPAAVQEYNAVIQYTLASPTQDPAKLSRLYSAMFNTGQAAQAMQGFNQLLASYPDDKAILADYMAALIEHKYYDEATRVANQYDKSSPYYGRGAALLGESKHVASVERVSQGREMKISFDKPTADAMPIDPKQVKKLAWVEDTKLGYDTLTVSAKPGYVVRFVPTANDQFAVVSAPVEQVSPQVETQRQQDLRLQLLYARIEQETGQTAKAQQRLAVLQQYYPQDSQLLGYRASVESAAGNRDEAKHLVKQAQAYNPENEDLVQLQQNLDYTARSTAHNTAGGGPQFIKLDGEFRSYGAHDEYISTLSGLVNVPGNNEMGFNLQQDNINPDNLVLPSTGEVTNKDVARDQAELFMAHYFENGNRLQGSLFVDGSSTLGGGAYYAFGNALGRTELLGEYHKAYWDYPQAAFAYANRDRVGFRHFANLSPETSLGLEMSANNYNIAFDDDQVKTGLFRLSLVHQLQAQTANQPYFGIGYGFDGEYKFGSDHNSLPSPITSGNYHPFDWRDREVHFLSGIYRDDWTPSTHALLVAGYAFDRLNDDGPSVEARITQDLSDQWELGVRGRYGIQTSGGGDVTDNDAINLGAHLMYKF
jgi:predicted Zn-dependent protease